MQKAKRILAVLLVLSMLFSMIPNAFAADEQNWQHFLDKNRKI